MSRAVRHLFACLLLVLLPFQALAAGFAMAEAPVVACAEQMMGDTDCCDDVCMEAGDCALYAAIAVPVAARTTPVFPGSDAAITPAPSLHESTIPDGLERPPQAFS